MLQKFSIDMSLMELYAQWEELATVMWNDRNENNQRVFSYPMHNIKHIIDIENPVLMTDYNAIHSIPDYLTRETIYMLYTKPVRCIEFDWYQMLFEQRNYLGVWWPSIDTVFCSKVLSKYDFTKIQKVAEVWCGSWFIWRYVAHKYPHIEELIFNDINPKAEQYYNDFPISGTKSRFVLGNANMILELEKFDFVVCNPPYIPRPNSIDDNPYEWLSLLHDLLYCAKKYLTSDGKLILNISSLTQPYFEKFIEDCWLKYRLLDSMESPLKVFNILHNKEWMDFLQCEWWLEQKDYLWHKWRHSILVYEVSL